MVGWSGVFADFVLVFDAVTLIVSRFLVVDYLVRGVVRALF